MPKLKSVSVNRNEEEEDHKMACRSALRSVLLTEAWRPVHLNRNSARASFRTRGSPATRLIGKFRCVRARDLHSAKRGRLCCSRNENPSSSSSSQDDTGPPQEAVLKAISGFAPVRYFKVLIFFFFCSCLHIYLKFVSFSYAMLLRREESAICFLLLLLL